MRCDTTTDAQTASESRSSHLQRAEGAGGGGPVGGCRVATAAAKCLCKGIEKDPLNPYPVMVGELCAASGVCGSGRDSETWACLGKLPMLLLRCRLETLLALELAAPKMAL